MSNELSKSEHVTRQLDLLWFSQNEILFSGEEVTMLDKVTQSRKLTLRKYTRMLDCKILLESSIIIDLHWETKSNLIFRRFSACERNEFNMYDNKKIRVDWGEKAKMSM